MAIAKDLGERAHSCFELIPERRRSSAGKRSWPAGGFPVKHGKNGLLRYLVASGRNDEEEKEGGCAARKKVQKIKYIHKIGDI